MRAWSPGRASRRGSSVVAGGGSCRRGSASGTSRLPAFGQPARQLTVQCLVVGRAVGNAEPRVVHVQLERPFSVVGHRCRGQGCRRPRPRPQCQRRRSSDPVGRATLPAPGLGPARVPRPSGRRVARPEPESSQSLRSWAGTGTRLKARGPATAVEPGRDFAVVRPSTLEAKGNESRATPWHGAALPGSRVERPRATGLRCQGRAPTRLARSTVRDRLQGGWPSTAQGWPPLPRATATRAAGGQGWRRRAG